jgi:hypothetical protein
VQDAVVAPTTKASVSDGTTFKTASGPGISFGKSTWAEGVMIRGNARAPARIIVV